jgi:hypothetical protein
VTLTLKLLRLWGAPQEWQLDGDEAEALWPWLGDFDDFKANGRSKAAVFVADDNGRIIASWNRHGIWAIASALDLAPPSPSPIWLEIGNALLYAASV